jgi:hypothetical protein
LRLVHLAVLGLALGPVAAQVSTRVSSSANPPASQSAPLHAQPLHPQPLNASHAGGGGPDGTQPIPEPSTLLLVGTGLLGVALTARWRRRPGKTSE